jgi:hypothetical protein
MSIRWKKWPITTKDCTVPALPDKDFKLNLFLCLIP